MHLFATSVKLTSRGPNFFKPEVIRLGPDRYWLRLLSVSTALAQVTERVYSIRSGY